MSDQAPLLSPSSGPLAGGWDFMCRGWRPAASWTCVAIMAARGLVMPLAELWRGQPVERFDPMMIASLGTMLGMAVLRGLDKRAGVAS